MFGVFQKIKQFSLIIKFLLFMETAVSSENASASDAISNKKLKYTTIAEDALTLDLDPSIATDPDSMIDSTLDLPNDSDLELDDLDDASDTSSYDDDDDFSYYDETLSLQAQFDAADLPPGVEASVPWLEEHEEKQKLGANLPSCASLAASSSPLTANGVTEEEEDKMFREFKSFDTVQDFSDHHYCKQASPAKRPGKDWAKAIQNDWRILEKDLPETIFVRVYEERMDLLRAVIIGAAGTPYHDGLFFFDVFFPSDYPKVPPKVYYYSGGLRLNPNLYGCGKVCLSLLGTWSGQGTENWDPGNSTMLQVLLSIQALVLNAKPYFNEPGYERTAGQTTGEKKAKDYNENTFVLSCKTMLYTLRRPPKHFEYFVGGHFRLRAQTILEACKEYIKGTEVGGLIEQEGEILEGELQEITYDNIGMKNFRRSLGIVVGNLIPALLKNGAKDCEKYIPLGDVTRTAPLKI